MHQTISEVADWKIVAAIVIFVITYTFIITEKINRTIIALCGAAIMLFIGAVSLDRVFTVHMQWGTITLLVGMMILVGITSKTGVFQYAAIKAAKLVKGEPLRILIIMSLLTAFGSAFLDNVTTVLLIVPVTFSITRMLGVNPIPFLISEVLFSNIGGTATLIGDPPNIMIGSKNGLSFNAFIFNLAPIIIIITIVTLAILYLMFRKQLKVSDDKKKELMALNEYEYIKDPKLMKKSLTVLVLTVLGFISHTFTGVEPSVVAMSGAALLMLIGVKEDDFEEVFYSVEWGTIFFFAGLFTIIGALVDVGVIQYLATEALNITGGNLAVASLLILWVSGFASATIDNIPYVATMIPLIQEMITGMGYSLDSAKIDVLWWSLALGACLGGNGTLIGASANVVVASMASKEGHGFSYVQFLKIGAPLTIVALILSTAYIYLQYLM